MNFEEARAEYARLRQSFDQRQISGEEFGQRVQALQVRDADGTYWAIDGNTGGWLRYDGSAWVPGQPPISPGSGFGQPQGGGFGQPQGGGFGQQQGGGFGQQQSGGFGQAQGSVGQPANMTNNSSFGQPGAGYTPGQQAGYTPTQPKKSSKKGLLIGCLAALVLLLLCGGIGTFLLLRSGGLSALTATGITDATTSTSVTSSNRPDQKADTFPVNQRMYVTYTASNVKQGDKVELQLFRDGVRETVTGGTRTFDKDSTFYGSFSYTPSKAGRYEAKFFLNGESTPSKTTEFTVK